jgi:hypothetical protein
VPEGLERHRVSNEHVAAKIPIEPTHDDVSFVIVQTVETFSKTIKKARRIRPRGHKTVSFLFSSASGPPGGHQEACRRTR